ncbi:MAG: hypothetical protein CVV53_07265, partial [Spirochaetae bacterium HGW-Spirochaetae-9]
GIAWIDLFLPQPSLGLFSEAWYALSTVKSAVRFAFIAFVMHRWLGFDAFGLRKPSPGISGFLPRAGDLANGLLVAAAAGAFALGLALFSLISKAQNPLLYPFQGDGHTGLSLFLMAVSSLGIGYSEELFFRFFAVTSLEKAGLSPALAALGSALLFGVSHGSQGFLGMTAAAMLALLFSFFRARGKGLHALAIGHALYDFVILLAVT